MNSFSNNKPDNEAFEFEVLGILSYSQSDRPPFWQNETSLLIEGMSRGNPPNIENASITDFPLIEDFEVRLENCRVAGKSLFGYHVRFFSPLRGYVADFPWWDHAEQQLIRNDFRIPLGSFQHPYSDLEQGWEIIIAAKDNFVYILQGDFDAPVDDGYYAWFKVDKEVYLAEWQKAIKVCRDTFQSL